MTKILITGSNGLLGQKLVSLLQKQPDVEIIATGRGQNRVKNKAGFTYLSMDIGNEYEVLTTIVGAKPDVIINTAAMTDVDACETNKEGCWEANVLAVDHLIKAAEAVKAFFLHVSTDFIFDGEAGPYLETDEPNPVSYYGESKLAAEVLVQKSKVRWAIARTVLVYGITEGMSRSNIILWVKKSLEEGKTINVVTDQLRSPTLAEDLAIGCWLIVDGKAEGVFNISGKDLMTPYDMAIATADYFRLNKDLIKKADATTFKQTATRPPKTGFVIDKARNILGYQPRSFAEGIGILAKQMK